MKKSIILLLALIITIGASAGNKRATLHRKGIKAKTAQGRLMPIVRKHANCCSFAAVAQSAGKRSALTPATAAPTDWGNWQKQGDEGTCTYTYSDAAYEIFGLDCDTLNIFERTSQSSSNWHQYKVEGWAFGGDLVITYDEDSGDMTVAEAYTGYTDADYGKVYASDIPTWSSDYSYTDFPNEFNTTKGRLYLYLIYYDEDGYWCYGEDVIQLAGYKDYDIAMQTNGLKEGSSDFETVLLNKGYSVGQANLIAVPGDKSSDVKNTIISNESSALYNIYKVSGTSAVLKLDQEGTYTIIAYTKDEAGNYQQYCWYLMQYSPSANWTSLGMKNYTDDILVSTYEDDYGNTYDPETYEVELQEHKTKKGLYRLVNPYGAAHPWTVSSDDYCENTVYLQFDAQNANAVMLPEQPLGCDWGYGMEYTWSNTKGKLADQKIKFPENGIDVWDSAFDLVSNKNGATCINLADTPKPQPGSNLVDNGTFEEWTSDSQPTGWEGWQMSQYANTGGAVLEKTTDAHDGSYACIVKGDTKNKRISTKQISLEAGTYTVEFWAKAVGTSGIIKPGYAYLQANGSALYDYGDYANDGITLTGNWKKVTYEFTVAEDRDVAMVVMNYKNSGDFIIDDYCLYGEQSEPESLTGDANEDGKVDVADITAIASYILGSKPETFNIDNADANQDNKIDVADITSVAGIILSK